MVLTAAVVAASGCLPTAADEARGATSAIVAKVGDRTVYRHELEAALRRAGYDETAAADQRRLVQATALEQLVDEQLLRGEIKRRKITASDAEVNVVIDQIRSQLAARKVGFDQFLAQSGGDEQLLRSQISFEIGLKKLLGPRVTKEALTDVYRKHHRDIDGTRLRASHILLRPDAGLGAEAVPALVRQANEIRGAILRGEISFADAATRFSNGPSRRRGGDVGFFPRRGLLVEEFSREAFALARGEVSKPFVTPFGVHLVTITDVQAGTADLEMLRPQLERILAQDCLREVLVRAVEETPVVYAAGVPYFDPNTPAGGEHPRRIIVGHASETQSDGR